MRLMIFTTLMLAIASVLADGPVDIYQFDNDEQQRRYKSLIEEFRCPKCLNTNNAGSDAPIAQDLRRTVHRLVVEEDFADDEVKSYLQARYGDFVLYKPPFNERTWLIWVAPFAILFIGLFVLYRLQRGARMAADATTDTALNEEDRERLQTLLERD